MNIIRCAGCLIVLISGGAHASSCSPAGSTLTVCQIEYAPCYGPGNIVGMYIIGSSSWTSNSSGSLTDICAGNTAAVSQANVGNYLLVGALLGPNGTTPSVPGRPGYATSGTMPYATCQASFGGCGGIAAVLGSSCQPVSGSGDNCPQAVAAAFASWSGSQSMLSQAGNQPGQPLSTPIFMEQVPLHTPSGH